MEEIDITEPESKDEILASIEEMLNTFGLSRFWKMDAETLLDLPINAYVWLCHRYEDLKDAVFREETL